MKRNQILGFFAATILMSTMAFAADGVKTTTSTLPAERDAKNFAEMKPSIGVMLGTFVPDDGHVATTNVGVDFMFQPRIPFSFGMEATHAEPASTVTGNKLRHTAVLAKADYNFGGTTPVIRSSYVGIGAGVQFQNSGTQFAAAPIIGFDIPLKDENGISHMTLGANAKYLYVAGNEDVDSNATSINAVMKFVY